MGGLKGANVKLLPAAPPAQAPVQVAPVAAHPPAVVDWNVECGHHAKDGARPTLNKAKIIEVVPDRKTDEDRVTLSYRNDAVDPPAEVRVDGYGGVLKAESKAPGKAQSKYKRYAFDAKFRGETSILSFWRPDFWRAFNTVTPYTIADLPGPIEVRVYCPRNYKVELKFPKLRSYSAGDKYSREVLRDRAGKYAGLGEKKHEKEAATTVWSGSKLKTLTRDDQGVKKIFADKTGGEREEKAAVPALSLTVDGAQASLDGTKIKEALDALVLLVHGIQEVQKVLKEAPKVGWYVEAEVQLFQGAVVAEWEWREHTDHRVFRYSDFYVEASIVSASIEFGWGFTSAKYKAQIYLAFEGELTLKAEGCRDHPDLPVGLTFPLRLEIAAKLGARFEAGNYLKADANGRSGLEFQILLGVWRNGRPGPYSGDFVINFTGIEVTATASVGFFGIKGQKTLKKKLADPKELKKVEWPGVEKVVPDVVSRDRIRQLVLAKLAEGTDARVVTGTREGWLGRELVEMRLEDVADRLADAIDAHQRFDRAPKAVEGLAAAIRSDLDTMAAKPTKTRAQGFIVEQELDAYIGDLLKARLDAMIPPSLLKSH